MLHAQELMLSSRKAQALTATDLRQYFCSMVTLMTPYEARPKDEPIIPIQLQILDRYSSSSSSTSTLRVDQEEQRKHQALLTNVALGMDDLIALALKKKWIRVMR